MLVLSLKPGEEVVIDGGSVVVSLSEIRGGKARVGFTADKSISIHRRAIQDLVDAGIPVAEAIGGPPSGSEGV